MIDQSPSPTTAATRAVSFRSRAAGLIGLFLLLTSASAAGAETLKGKVVGVTDGDTVRLLVDGRDLCKIRLGEIDAPESGQPFGRASKRMLSNMVFGQTVTARVTDIDRYGRSVAVLSRGTTNINAEMVRQGGAWAYRRYLSDQRYLLWEKEAREQRRGLWRLQADQIMPPWEWRAARRGRNGTTSSILGAPSANASAWYRAAAVPTAAGGSSPCGAKRLCRQMTSCAEAQYHLRTCGLSRLDGDGDGDGVPCEKLCG